MTAQLDRRVPPAQPVALGARRFEGRPRPRQGRLGSRPDPLGFGERRARLLESGPLVRYRTAEPGGFRGEVGQALHPRPRPKKGPEPLRIEAACGERLGHLLRLPPQAFAFAVGIGEQAFGFSHLRLLAFEVAGQRRRLAPCGAHAAGHVQALRQGCLRGFEPGGRLLRFGQTKHPGRQGLLRGILEVHRELAGDELGLAPGLGRAGVGDPVHVLVHAEVQERDQDLAALLGLPLQERVELALGQHHRAREGVVVETDDLHDLGLDLLHAVRRGLPAFPVPVLQPDLHGPVVRPGAAGDAIAAAPHLELEEHGQPLGLVADELAVFLAHAGHLAVEGKDQRIDERRLAGARGAGDGKEVEPGEVEDQPFAERGEALDFQLERSHERAPERKTSSLGRPGRASVFVSVFVSVGAPPWASS